MQPPLQPELDSLVDLIHCEYQQTDDDSQLDKLQFALQLAEQARDFIAGQDTGPAWLRLNGAVGFLRMAGVEVGAIQARLDRAL